MEHRSASGAVGVTLSGKRWEVAHDFGKKVTAVGLNAILNGLQLWVSR